MSAVTATPSVTTTATLTPVPVKNFYIALTGKDQPQFQEVVGLDVKQDYTTGWMHTSLTKSGVPSHNLMAYIIGLKSGSLTKTQFLSLTNPLLDKLKNTDRSYPMGTYSGFGLFVDLLHTARILGLDVPTPYLFVIWRLIATSRNLDIARKAAKGDGHIPQFTQNLDDSKVYGKPRGRKGDLHGVDLPLDDAFTSDVASTALWRVEGCLHAEFPNFKGAVSKLDPTRNVDTSTDQGKLIVDYRSALKDAYMTLVIPTKPIWQSPLCDFFKNGIKFVSHIQKTVEVQHENVEESMLAPDEEDELCDEFESMLAPSDE